MGKSKAERDAETYATALEVLRRFGLRFPGAQIKTPWPGHKDLAVNDKTFCYLPPEGGEFSIGCKLPHSGALALMLPFCKPTAYGLGKSGWVTATPAPDQIDVEMFKQWIEESYRAQAPKKWIEQIGMPGPFGFDEDPFIYYEGPHGAAKPSRARPAAAKQAATKKLKPATKKLVTRKPPATKQPATKQPTAKQLAAKQPGTRRPTTAVAKKSVAKPARPKTKPRASARA